jgi:hypothetical protein
LKSSGYKASSCFRLVYWKEKLSDKYLTNACYHSFQNHLSFRLLSENIKIRIYRTLILPAALYGCESWSLILREENRLRVFENRVPRRIFGRKSDRRLEKTA